MFRLILTLVILVTSTGSAQTAGFYTTAPVPYQYAGFNTITTEHFDIHYPTRSSEDFFIPENMHRIAKLCALYMEDGFAKLTKDLNSTPYLRIQVVIVDNTDSHNGFATPVPQNTIYIYAIPPLSHTSISEYDNWLKDTSFHELTHIINLSTTRGYSVPLRAIFGTVVSINGMSPLNLIEGYTVFEETNMTSKGRGRSTFLHTMLRTSANEKDLDNDTVYELSKAPYTLDEWPMGNRPYLFGFLLFEHVALKYGLDVPGKISKHNAGVVPYYPSYSFEQFTGKNIAELWSDTLKDKNVAYKEWISNIKKEEETKIDDKATRGCINRNPSVSPDGKYIAYYNLDPDRRNALIIADATTGKELHRRRTDDASFVKWLDNDTVIFNRLEEEVYGNYYDVKTYNVNDLLVHTLSNSERILYLDPIDKDTLCVVRAKTGITTLNIEQLNERKFKTIKTLYSSDLLSRISAPNCRSSSKGIKAYFIEKKADSNEQIISIDENGTKRELYSSSGSIKDIALSKTKDELLFIDDKDGVFNVYKMDLDNNEISRVTNLISGAFNITASSEPNKAYISYYSTNGFKIGKVDTNKTYNKVHTAKPMELPIRITATPEIKDLENKKYWPTKTLIPKFWIPAFAFVEKGYTIGGLTYGADALFQHQYFASGAYDSRTKKPLIGLAYTNQSFYPSFTISAYSDNTWLSDSEIIQDLDSSILMNIPLNTSWSIFTGTAYSYRKLDFIGVRTKRFGLFWGVGFNETSNTLSSISSAETGFAGFLRYSLYPKSMDSSYNEYQIDSNLSFFIPLWEHHVLAFNNDLAYSYGNPYMFFVVGVKHLP